MSDATPVELSGPPDGGWFTTRIFDWIGLCPDLRDADVRGYVILRALVIEKYEQRVRQLTLSLLCELIPGPNGKPSSLTRVRDILGNLSAVGLVSTPDGGPVRTSSRANAAQKPIRIQINDLPAPGYTGWRNAEQKLRSLTSTEPGAGRNSDPHPAPDQRKPSPPIGSPLGSSLSPGAGTSANGTGEEREQQEADDGPPPHPQAGEAEAFVAGLPGDLGRKSVADLAPLVLAAFDAGWAARDLRDLLRKRVDVTRVFAPDSVYRKHLENLPDAPRRRQAPAGGMCPRHSWALADDCSACRAAARDRGEPTPVSGMAELFASLGRNR